MIQVINFGIGFIVGAFINALWRRRGYDKPARAMEHYHWAMILAIAEMFLENGVLVGIGSTLILDECWGQDHPFAHGSDHFIESSIIGAVIFAIMMSLWIWSGP
jgi:hypothetical protein